MHRSEDPDSAADVLKMILAGNLRVIRRERGLSQEAMAQELGLDLRYYSGIERGERNLQFDTVGAMADKLGVHPLELLSAGPALDDEE